MKRLFTAGLIALSLLISSTTCFAAGKEDAIVEISPAMETALRKGLAYLAKRQTDEGCWVDSSYGKNVGSTGLCLMAFMSMGNLPGEGEYGANVARGVNWVIAQAKPSGLIQYTKQAQQAPVMYGHALATLMLSEVWGQTRRKDVGQVLRRAVDLIIKVQGPKGGWNYESIPKDGDTSVCVMQAFALKSAHHAGIYVPKETIDRALKLIQTRLDKRNHGYGYNNNKLNMAHIGSSAAGTTIMQICGVTDEQYTTQPMLKLMEVMKKNGAKESGFKFYYAYYTSVCVYNSGEDQYAKWIKMLEPWLLKRQRRDGSWGAYYDTAFAILAGALPYRYIPVYQR